MNRRQFLKTSGTGIAGLLAARPLFAAPGSNAVGANSDIRVAVIGFNAHGKSHIRAYKSIPGVRIVALCDVDDQVLRAQAAELDREGIKVKTYRDMRAVFDSPEVDVVSMSTPNHWHALGTVWACQAGKDVCVEKPISHCIWEGRKMVEAARKYDRIVQADLDARSGGRYDEISEYLRSGQLGRIVYVRCWNYIRRPGIGKVPGPQKIPEHIDYDLWTGPAPLLPLMREKFHYDWHWQWPTGNGEIANNGSHNLDQVRWLLGKSSLPKSVTAFGGRYGYVDDGDTPNTHTAIYDYDGIPVIYEARGLSESAQSENMDGFIGETVNGRPVSRPHNGPGRNSGHVVFCENGYAMGGAIYDNDGKEIKRFESGDRGGDGPQANFIKGVRSRKLSDLKIDVLEGHLSVTFCHMGNVPIQCGELLPFDQARRSVPQTPHAEKAFDRMLQHLKANGVDPATASITVGPTLTMDAEQERFVGEHSAVANLFLKDTYREPFVIRDRV